jgi:hypothetical protein
VNKAETVNEIDFPDAFISTKKVVIDGAVGELRRRHI